MSVFMVWKDGKYLGRFDENVVRWSIFINPPSSLPNIGKNSYTLDGHIYTWSKVIDNEDFEITLEGFEK